MYTGTTCIKADVWQFSGMLKRKDHRNNLSDATGAAQHGHNTISRTNKSPSFNSESDRAQMEIKPPRIYIPTKVTLRSHNAQRNCKNSRELLVRSKVQYSLIKTNQAWLLWKIYQEKASLSIGTCGSISFCFSIV